MALDGIVINKIVNSLNNEVPIRINKIYSVGKNEIIFHVRSNKTSKKMIISGDANQNRIHFTSKHYANDIEPSNFVMLLRKYLSNAQIINLKQYNFDRIIQLEIENFDSIGDLKTYYIYLELMGRYANIIFTNEENIIFDSIKRISPFESNKQAIVPGAKYSVIYDDLKKDLYKTSNFDINLSLVEQFSGVSPTLEKEILFRLSNLNESFDDIISEISKSKNIVISKNDRESDYHVIPLKHKYLSFHKYSYEDAFDTFYYERSQQDRIKNATMDLLRFLRKEVKKLNRKLIKINDEIEKNLNSNINLKYGDLITTYQYQLKKGMKYANLNDFETNEKISIVLDEKLTPNENAQKYYKLYKKQSKSITHLNNQIEIATKELNYFNLLIEQLKYADINSAKEIKQELIDRKYLFEKAYKKPKKKSKPNILQIVYENTLIKVGKNNIQNDYILKLANRNDYWFHVKDYHGSHVIVSTDNLSDDIMEIAATLATYFSQARDSNKVEVNYTQVRNVKKTNQKGLVTLKEFQSITIDNDFNLIKDYL